MNDATTARPGLAVPSITAEARPSSGSLSLEGLLKGDLEGQGPRGGRFLGPTRSVSRILIGRNLRIKLPT